jgi:hypothetical protein
VSKHEPHTERLGQPVHRVEYVIRSRKIQPAGRAGSLRVLSEEQVTLLESEIASMDHKKGASK